MEGTRLLIVEDDRITCKLLRLIFAEMGLDVITAHTVADGLALLGTRPDYLVLDMTLPDGEGREILERVRQEGLRTRVIVTTGWGAACGVEDLQPDSVLCKPIEPGEILHRLGLPLR
jgi:DNA-binding response OmpR family regulator